MSCHILNHLRRLSIRVCVTMRWEIGERERERDPAGHRGFCSFPGYRTEDLKAAAAFTCQTAGVLFRQAPLPPGGGRTRPYPTFFRQSPSAECALHKPPWDPGSLGFLPFLNEDLVAPWPASSPSTRGAPARHTVA